MELLGLSYFVSTRGTLAVFLKPYLDAGFTETYLPTNWDCLMTWSTTARQGDEESDFAALVRGVVRYLLGLRLRSDESRWAGR